MKYSSWARTFAGLIALDFQKAIFTKSWLYPCLWGTSWIKSTQLTFSARTCSIKLHWQLRFIIQDNYMTLFCISCCFLIRISWWVLHKSILVHATCNIQSWFDASTGARHWCDHWKQCVWFIPGKGVSISKDEEVHLHAVHTDTNISYNLKTRVPRAEVMQYGFNTVDSQLILSPERIAIYGESEWRNYMLKAISNAVRSLSLSLTCMHICRNF